MGLSQRAMVAPSASRYPWKMDAETREFLEQLAAMMAREFARINQRFEAVDARFDRIETRLDGHDRRFDNLEATVADLRREMRSEFALVRKSIGRLERVVGVDEVE